MATRIPSSKSRPAFPKLAAVCVFLCLAANHGIRPQAAPDQTSLTPEQANRIVQRIDDAVYRRFNAVARYTVQEQYSVYRSGETTPSAQETVQTLYVRSAGKQYTPTAQSGSTLLRDVVIDKVLAGEKEVNLPANRDGALITSRNYEMQPQPGQVERNGHQCLVVDLKSRRKSPHLFNGKIWVDAADFSIVRLEGAPSQSPSLFAGDTTVSRDYATVDGFSMAVHAEAHSHSSLFGDTFLKIDYTNYQVQLGPPSLDPISPDAAGSQPSPSAAPSH